MPNEYKIVVYEAELGYWRFYDYEPGLGSYVEVTEEELKELRKMEEVRVQLSRRLESLYAKKVLED